MQFVLLLKCFKVLTLGSAAHFGMLDMPTLETGWRKIPFIVLHLQVFQSFEPLLLLSLEVIVVAVIRHSINRFTLSLPALCFRERRFFTPREGQVGGDAVPDPVAHHVVVAAVCADQLRPVKGGDEVINDNRAFQFPSKYENDVYLSHSFFFY